jgi:hypothetical protein
MKNKIYQSLALKIRAMDNCQKSKNETWLKHHHNFILELMEKTAPSGSGIDCGTEIDICACNANKLVFIVKFHHMNENGFYDGWTQHNIIVTPDLVRNFNLRVTGRDRNQIKEYLHEVYSTWLNEETEI